MTILSVAMSLSLPSYWWNVCLKLHSPVKILNNWDGCHWILCDYFISLEASMDSGLVLAWAALYFNRRQMPAKNRKGNHRLAHTFGIGAQRSCCLFLISSATFCWLDPSTCLVPILRLRSQCLWPQIHRLASPAALSLRNNNILFFQIHLPTEEQKPIIVFPRLPH